MSAPASTLLGVIDTGPGSPAWNMALDEALLVRAASALSSDRTFEGVARGTGQPAPGNDNSIPGNSATLRFYLWTAPGATFGYSQRYEEIARQTGLRPLIRRCSGGGLVPHDRDWTYSLTAPPGHPWYELSATESYRTVHDWIRASLERLGCTAELADCCHKPAPGQCFVGHEKYDVLWHGRKIAGAAQRRNRCGLLIQGSLQPPPPVESLRAHWMDAMILCAPTKFFRATSPVDLPEDTLRLAASLEADKYSLAAYNQSR